MGLGLGCPERAATNLWEATSDTVQAGVPGEVDIHPHAQPFGKGR